jgi:hypothetical protein
MAVGYYYDSGTKSYKHTTDPVGGYDPLTHAVSPTVGEAMAHRGDQPIPTDYANAEDAGNTSYSEVPKIENPNLDKFGSGASGAAAKGGGVEDVAAAGLLATGNPVGIGAGLGMMTLSAVNKQKQANRQAEYENKVREQQIRQDAINNLAHIGQGLKVV